MSATIYMELLDEGTTVWRPVEAEPLPGGVFKVIGPVPEGEEWAFPPGTVVRCKDTRMSDGTFLAAYEAV